MLSSLTRNWWVAALRGVLAIAFGIAAFAWPGVTIEILVLLFGTYALIDGVSSLVQGLQAAGSPESWFALTVSGLVGIAAGILTFVQPALTALSLVYVIAAWTLLTGGLQIVTAVRMRHVISGEWLLGLGGALSIIFGVALMRAPLAGALALVLLFGFYAIASGVSQLVFALKLRGLGQHLPRHQTATSTAN
jgi:uncharacterized membrane protein HdeD (DUF308 family)